MIVRESGIPYLFVHNPRTGGTSIREFLISYCGGREFKFANEFNSHRTKHRVYSETPKKFQTYYKFGFVRNPFCREVSLYKLLTQQNQIPFKQWIVDRFSTEEIRDSELARMYCLYRQPQYGFFCDLTGRLNVNVFKYENRGEALSEIGGNIAIANIPTAYRPNINSPRFGIRNYQAYYDNEMIDLINKFYSVDLEAFGYSFDGEHEPKAVSFQFKGDPSLYAINFKSNHWFEQKYHAK